jgi:hypothetical protein
VNATDKFALNASIERLIDSKGHDAEARAAIAEFGHGLRRGSPVSFNAAVTKTGDKILGHTPEHGSILAGDDRPDTKEYSRGEVVERIGYYKIYRVRRWVCMSHFWKSSLGTESETELAQEWALALDKNGKPEWFGERGRQPVFSFHLTSSLLIQVSRNVFVESWGPVEGLRHLGGFLLVITVEVSRDK